MEIRIMKKNQIIKIHGTDYKENTIALLEKADLASHIPSNKARIAIKPNLVSSTPASYGATTHPEVIAGIIEYLQGHGFNNLLIMESSWVGDKTEDAFLYCGYQTLSETYQVPLLDLQKADSVKMDCAGMQLSLCRPPLDVDFLINVPVLKGHCQTRITCALKNMKGLIPNKEKRRFHTMGLHKPIAHLNAGIRQDFIVIDHICGDLDFEDGGHPVIRNEIWAACDPVLVDSLVCQKLHYELDDVPYISLAEKLGVGSTDLNRADIIEIKNKSQLTGKEEVQPPLPLPRKAVLVEDAVEEVESCSACYGALIPALSRLQEEGLLEGILENMQDHKICIGQGFRGKTGWLGVGSCTSLFDHSIAGCPPSEDQIYEGLKDLLAK